MKRLSCSLSGILTTFTTIYALQTTTPIERRGFIAYSSTVWLPPLVSKAETADLTSSLYNPDGSLREDVAREAKERLVSFSWGIEEDGIKQVDGKSNSGSTGKVSVSYKLPAKWISNEEGMYMDQSEGVNAKAADHIYVYQAPGLVKSSDLERASTIGVGKSLQIIPELHLVNEADLVSGRKSEKDGQVYYEFDMASAPKTCGDSDQNLGLGFCPYNRIFLLSATLSDTERLYVFCVECDTAEWKQANADLKRLRSSFRVSL
jgi:hypothetical protein